MEGLWGLWSLFADADNFFQAAMVDAARVVDKARKLRGFGVDFSGTHSQPDDVGRATVASEIFGSETLATSVQKLKKTIDPNNRFRFHPFAKFIA